MAISSGGGHWAQLMRLKPAFDGMDVFYVSLDKSYYVDVMGYEYYCVSDFSRKKIWTFFILVLQFLRILIKERPSVIVTTGSAPALICLILAKFLFRSHTMWIDSIANVEKLSTSGETAGKIADVWLTQWPHIAKGSGKRPQYWGAVL